MQYSMKSSESSFKLTVLTEIPKNSFKDSWTNILKRNEIRLKNARAVEFTIKNGKGKKSEKPTVY
jgi:hypothetical protein